MSEWTVRKRAGALQTGDRFIFDEEMGGEGQALTVRYIVSALGVVEIYTEELDFEVTATAMQMLGVPDA